MNKDVCAVILAGGKSSRMGRDKAALMLGDETFLQRIAAELDACGFQEKYVSLGTGTAEKTEIRIPASPRSFPENTFRTNICDPE